MSILFNDLSYQYLQRDETPVVSFPFAISCWIYIDDTSINQTLVCLADRHSNVNYFALQLTSEGKVRAKTVGVDGHIEKAESASSISPNTWHHALGIWNSESDVNVFLDGSNQGVSPGSGDGSGGLVTPEFFDSSSGISGPDGLDTIAVGRLSTLTKQQYVSGRIAEVTIWDNSTSLETDEIEDLGIYALDPLLVRTDEITFHAPLVYVDVNPTIDIVGGYNLTIFNSPTNADHPPLQYYDPETFARFRSGPIEFERVITNAVLLAAIANWELLRRPSNDVTFNQIVLTNIIQVTVEQNITFSSDLAKQATINISIDHSLIFDEETPHRTYEDSASNSVTFAAAAYRGENPDNDILFDQSVTPVASTGVSTSVTFGQTVSVQADLTVQLSNNVLFGQTALGYYQDSCGLQSYEPWGVGTSLVIGSRTTITLVSGIYNIELRNPDVGNTESVDVDRTFNTSRGGKPQLMRDSNWPESVTHTIRISVMSKTKAQELQTFIQNSLGKLITYTDYEERTWEGILVNPDTALSDNGTCKYSAELVLAVLPT